MRLKIYTPSPPLSRYIDSFVYYDGYDAKFLFSKFLPDGSVNLMIELDELQKCFYRDQQFQSQFSFKKAWISGMQEQYFYSDGNPNSIMFTVQFKAGGSYPFFRLPLHELSNLSVDAELILGKRILHLREQLLDANGDPHLMFSRVEEFFWKQFVEYQFEQSVLEYAIQTIQVNPALVNLKAISEKTGYSQKQFIYLFKKHVGLTPKSYHKIIRFNRALQQIPIQTQVDWSQVGLDCGYYDQAHLIKEFKLFSGYTPKNYLVCKSEYPNIIPLPPKK